MEVRDGWLFEILMTKRWTQKFIDKNTFFCIHNDSTDQKKQ